jgi:DNA-binding transcriptional LysR family regulator
MFGSRRRPDWAVDVAEVPLFDDAFSVIVRRNHPLARIKNPTRKQLAAYDWVVPALGTPRRQAIEGFFEDTSAPVTFSIETSSISVIRALVTSSDRISVLARHEVEFEERAYLFAILPVRIGAPSTKGITMRANWLPTALHQEFIDQLKIHAASDKHETHGMPLRIANAR